MKRFLLVAALLGAAGLGASLSSCIAKSALCDGPNDSCQTYACPSEAVFTGLRDGGAPSGASVSEYMARRCGTLDCHGSEARPMRLYGRLGLREPAESNISGGKATTPAELIANYGSVCSVEPEKTDEAVQDQGQSAELLLVVQKARGIEGHKGGAVVKQGGHGDNCIAGWLRGDPSGMVASECQAAINGL